MKLTDTMLWLSEMCRPMEGHLVRKDHSIIQRRSGELQAVSGEQPSICLQACLCTQEALVVPCFVSALN